MYCAIIIQKKLIGNQLFSGKLRFYEGELHDFTRLPNGQARK
jgi:hypothetical protein